MEPRPMGGVRGLWRAGALAGLLALACGGGASHEGAGAEAAADPSQPGAGTARRQASGRAPRAELPVLEGLTLEGHPLSTAAIAGRRLVVFFFRPGPEPAALAPAFAALAPLRAAHNFELLGVAVGTSPEAALRFVGEQQLGFPILDDAGGGIARRMGLVANRVAVVVADASGQVTLARRRFEGPARGGAERLAASLREALRLAAAPPGAGELLARPPAPEFDAPALEGDARIRLGDLRGRPIALVFFLYHCPYCQTALRTLQTELAAIEAERRPALVGIETSNQPEAIRPALAAAGIEPFPVALDADHLVRDAYAVFGDVPVIVMIDADGGVVYRTKPGWDADRDPDIVATWLARTAGVPVPMRLREHGYTGNDVCGACHAAEYATWALTSHSRAFDTLVTHGADRDAKCVGCHAVGFGEPGGFALEDSHGAKASDFEDVGCESCHGRGGPHLSPDFVGDHDYAPVCAGCHDAEHSLGFDYARASPRISHAAIAALTPAERRERFGPGRRREVLPAHASFVGSEVCGRCHASEHATWLASGHARAFASLERAGRSGDSDCLGCHTTGFGREGGFSGGGPATAHPDLARVGCESCHGPGGDHVAPDAPRRGTILALTEKCDSCVILQICRDCHDDANDPGFAFEVEAHIERQRHGNLRVGSR